MSYLIQRRKIVLGDLNLASCRGLEIGPLNNPIIRKDEGHVAYVDYGTTETVRRQHAKSSTIDPDAIHEIDYVWGEASLRETIPDRYPFDYAVAAHVIEHVPDVVGWLLELHEVLKRGGLLGLIVPDRRHTFDFLRAESTLGEMMEAYLQRYRRPSMRQVFDHCWYAVNIDKSVSWNRDPADLPLPKMMGDVGLRLAHDQAASLRTEARYFDSHCWVFTPASFLLNCEALAELGYFPFLVEHAQSTLVDEFEFFVRLRTHDPADRAASIRSIRAARDQVAHDPNEQEYARRLKAWRTGAAS